MRIHEEENAAVPALVGADEISVGDAVRRQELDGFAAYGGTLAIDDAPCNASRR
jgi:hypothetical protein